MSTDRWLGLQFHASVNYHSTEYLILLTRVFFQVYPCSRKPATMHNFRAILSGLRPRRRINNEGGQAVDEHQERHRENESVYH